MREKESEQLAAESVCVCAVTFPSDSRTILKKLCNSVTNSPCHRGILSLEHKDAGRYLLMTFIILAEHK